ncbi:MAG: hypothetical protein WC479_05795 [Candidatus Izemoplasmatales bacterium]
MLKTSSGTETDIVINNNSVKAIIYYKNKVINTLEGIVLQSKYGYKVYAFYDKNYNYTSYMDTNGVFIKCNKNDFLSF